MWKSTGAIRGSVVVGKYSHFHATVEGVEDRRKYRKGLGLLLFGGAARGASGGVAAAARAVVARVTATGRHPAARRRRHDVDAEDGILDHRSQRVRRVLWGEEGCDWDWTSDCAGDCNRAERSVISRRLLVVRWITARNGMRQQCNGPG